VKEEGEARESLVGKLRWRDSTLPAHTERAARDEDRRQTPVDKASRGIAAGGRQPERGDRN
jgi:hypothetical protein